MNLVGQNQGSMSCRRRCLDTHPIHPQYTQMIIILRALIARRLAWRYSATLMLLALPAVFAQNISAQKEVVDIRNLYSKINQEILREPNRCRRYVATPEAYEAQKWRRIDSDTEFDQKHYARASICYLQKQYLAKATIEVFSMAGDWADHREHYFYANGKLAFFFERQSTTQAYDNVNNREIPGAPYILERRLYFDQNGKLLRRLEKAYASKGQQEFPLRFIYPIDFEIYMSIDKLPSSPIPAP